MAERTQGWRNIMVKTHGLLFSTPIVVIVIATVALAAPVNTRSRVDSYGMPTESQLLTDKDVGTVASDLQALVPSLMSKAHIPGLQIALPASKSGVVYLTNSYYGLSVSSELVAHSVGGQALGSLALNYQPYDSPLLRFVWDLQERGPAAVNELDRLKRENPGMFRDEFGVAERQWLAALTTSLQRAGMTKEALALLEYDVAQYPRSGRAAMAAADGCLKTGDQARAARHLERALEATEERVDTAILTERLRYVAALDQPVRVDLSGKWSGAMWASDGKTIDLVTLVLEKHGNGYRGTLADTLGQIPAGTKIGDVRRFQQRENPGGHRRAFPLNLLFDNVEPSDPAGNSLAFTLNVPGSEIRVGMMIEGATLKGRWVDVWRRNNGPLQLAWAGR